MLRRGAGLLVLLFILAVGVAFVADTGPPSESNEIAFNVSDTNTEMYTVENLPPIGAIEARTSATADQTHDRLTEQNMAIGLTSTALHERLSADITPFFVRASVAQANIHELINYDSRPRQVDMRVAWRQLE